MDSELEKSIYILQCRIEQEEFKISYMRSTNMYNHEDAFEAYAYINHLRQEQEHLKDEKRKLGTQPTNWKEDGF